MSFEYRLNYQPNHGDSSVSDKEQIQDTIQTYFDSMYESSSDKAHAAFHSNAKITGYLEDGLHEM